MAKVVKPFPYAADGFTLEHLVPGDERDFGAATAGLVEEGFIATDGPHPQVPDAPDPDATTNEASPPADDQDDPADGQAGRRKRK
ncbi:MAG: hypothetical protein E5W44_07190 [Mesorhizobium sp.]|nr:MAG: hypothetical protein E5W44_07190 [Mesorhizobium sp.]